MKFNTNYITTQIKRLKKDQKGIAAVEFALILPLMAMLLLGTFEFGQAFTVDRRVTQAASSVADLVAQSETIDDAELDTIMDLAAAILAPYDANLLNVEVTSVVADGDGDTTVGWSYAKDGGTPHAEGSDYSMTGELANLISPSNSVIIAKATYNYTPIIGSFLLGGVNLEETFYLRPRRNAVVTKE